MRKMAYRNFNEKGTHLAKAIEEAMACQELKTRCLITPMAVSVAAVQARAAVEEANHWGSRGSSAAANIEGKWADEFVKPPPKPWMSGGKPVSRHDFNARRVWTTIDGKPICRRLGENKCTDPNQCKMLHVCDYCAGAGYGELPHKSAECKHRPDPQSSDSAATIRKGDKAGGGKGGKGGKGKGDKGKAKGKGKSKGWNSWWQ